MRIGLRLLLAFFLVLGLALFVVLRVFIEEVKPGTRLAMEDSLVDAANALALVAAPDLKAGTIASGSFAQAHVGAALGGPGRDHLGLSQVAHRLPHHRHRRARHRGVRQPRAGSSARTIRSGTTCCARCAASTARAPAARANTTPTAR